MKGSGGTNYFKEALYHYYLSRRGKTDDFVRLLWSRSHISTFLKYYVPLGHIQSVHSFKSR